MPKLIFNVIANEPPFEGIVGISLWKTNFTEAEQVALIGNLYRHYFIEGRRDMWTRTPYQLRHVRNPGFGEGFYGWTARWTRAGQAYEGKAEPSCLFSRSFSLISGLRLLGRKESISSSDGAFPLWMHASK